MRKYVKPWDPEGPDSRTAILDAAESRFARQGIEGASMREIASDVGITKAALYYHFAGKAELYDAVCERLSREYIPVFERIVAAPESPVTRLRRFVRALLSAFLERPNMVALVQRSMLDPDEDRAKRCVELGYGAFFGLLMRLAADLRVRGSVYQWSVMVVGMCFAPFQIQTIAAHLPGRTGEDRLGAKTLEALEANVLLLLDPQAEDSETGEAAC